MGTFLSGLVFNKNFQNDEEFLYKILKMNVVETEEITFEEATKKETDLYYFDVYYSKQGTLILFNYDLCLEPYLQDEFDIMTFIIAVHSGSYLLNYSEKGIAKLTLKDFNGKIQGKGKKILLDSNLSLEELIYQYFEKLLGKEFGEILNEEKVIRCHVSNYDWKKQVEINKTDILKPLSVNFLNEEEIFDLFDKLIQYCKTNRINFFLNSSLHKKENLNIIKNINDIKKKIDSNANLHDRIKPKFPMNSYNMIGKFTDENLDHKTTFHLEDLIKNVDIKKEFAKRREDEDLENETIFDKLFGYIFLLIILAVFVGMIFLIYFIVNYL